jgi:hypothetical protein
MSPFTPHAPGLAIAARSLVRTSAALAMSHKQVAIGHAAVADGGVSEFAERSDPSLFKVKDLN